MSEDYTRPDLGLFGQLEAPEGPVNQEVDDILGAVIDGRYEVVTRLGQGGMGFVYEARDLALGGREVVLKTLRPELVNNEKTAQRFSREAMVQARIDHENVIVVTGHGVTEDYGAYYVMERLVGQDLGTLLATLSGPMPVPRVLSIVSQVAAALGAAHALAIVHRDLKPENIYLTTTPEGRELVKVLDFGLARMLDAGNKLTETGAVIGTPRYMAPEQCHGKKADARADIYSLGLVMYEMLSGVQPYAHLRTYEILGKKMFDDVKPLSELEPPVDLDPRLEAFVMRCLSRSPEARLEDGARLGEELRSLEAQLREPSLAGAVEPGETPWIRHRSDAPPAPSAIKPPSFTGSAPALPVAVAPTAVAVAPAAPRPRALWAALLGCALLGFVGLFVAGVAFVFLSRPDAPPSSPTAAPSTAPGPVAVAPEVSEPAVDTVATIHVRTEPAGADVRHEGRLLGQTPLELRVPRDVAEGDTIELSLDGYATRTIRITSDVPTAHVRLHESP